jgi:peptide-methionine (S)-S-oxide reductase
MKLTTLFALLGALLMPMTSTAAADSKTETLVLGGGCFWCTEGAYEIVPGVKAVVSGYSGGKVKNPTYEQICTGTTGHAEVIRIEYDPAQVSLERLLELFWVVHDPTTLNAQGNDHGTQYRSVIYYASDAQKEAAEKSKGAAQAKFRDPIVTEITPLGVFYEAETYHQDYFRKNPNAGYCQYVVKSKVDKMKKALGKK